MQKQIAIVEDEAAIRDNYVEFLSRQGYQVTGFDSRQTASTAFANCLPDLVILDIGLNDEIDGGFELCRELRARSSTLPIIFLTARDDDFDTVAGLRLGADDYLTKEISLPHLSARIAALFRRMRAMEKPVAENQVLQRGDLQLDIDRLTTAWREQAVDLTVTEFWLTHSLVRHPGHVRNRDQLMDDANILVDASSISTHIKRIRRKFQQVDEQFDAIEAVYGAGYRWHQPGS
ncbi:MAG: proteobacterial dedicated sortase system response regulator [gamma proteobacterium endosymbiont of Lamellibrachia anaximandri]|nr:proteobacterial dedicated sortase system response regulator [gamma proteobacterium endosymbiont of Lamellibrachia anaximandri]MBL3533904.1 proteobacterial dedicated sortase system response regulator [gamma proteobacterium endosymbiont of Lamellibrachia anaximandri]